MGKSLIQVVNQSDQTLTANSIINLGTIQRRYGNDLNLSGNAIECSGCGYFEIIGSISVTPTSVGNVTVALYENGVQIPGAIAYGSISTAANPVAMPLVATIRRGCRCEGADHITAVLVEGDGVVNNVSLRIVKS